MKRSMIMEKLTTISISIAKIKKTTCRNLVFLKKSTRKKRSNLNRHYNYGFIQEYEFSPSNSPVFMCNSKQRKQSGGIYSALLFMCACLGRFEGQLDDGWFGEVEVKKDEAELLDSRAEEGSIDERAERFIERFYEQIRMPRIGI
ncbi:hypothetical protein Droror1_Dr00022418 [Drosera rotundifolia]